MEHFRLNPPTKLDENSGIIGLDKYVKSLEKFYFSEVLLRKHSESEQAISITIDMKCNVCLTDILDFYRKGRWGYGKEGSSPLKDSLALLSKKNAIALDIEELTFFFEDTSIIIKRIYNKSIPEQLNEILDELVNHYIYFSKGLTEIPYEIFIPVFEDSLLETGKEQPVNFMSNDAPTTYFNFWGVYLESHEDALIYDVNKNIYIVADLDLHMIE